MFFHKIDIAVLLDIVLMLILVPCSRFDSTKGERHNNLWKHVMQELRVQTVTFVACTIQPSGGLLSSQNDSQERRVVSAISATPASSVLRP